MTTALSQNSVLFSAIYKRCTAVAIKTRDEGRGNYPTFLFCLFLNKFSIFFFFFLFNREERIPAHDGTTPFFFFRVCASCFVKLKKTRAQHTTPITAPL